ncbi:alcohol dehydrogenase catalytic domain-containing protein [Planobispora takensis]|uniref:alcohol dehydrogenase (NADP(+)) n=1 Tax=Planobispora takensis TaxID=1367882 RepID=A0A8J3TDY0_9ACTN|nr:alcohol dehydrogenase catalytic domain-containing protein [Planobispora takensis]GII05569.1 hypothetical protein Pta02_75770 [Planobispora takensis]
MNATVHAYGVTEAGQPLRPVAIERRDVGPHDIKLDIQYCGICHSDIHFARGDFGPLPVSPLVPGHEIIGTVTEVGSEVTKHQVGDRVGIGCMVNSCRECANCRQGEEQYCLLTAPGAGAAPGNSTQPGAGGITKRARGQRVPGCHDVAGVSACHSALPDGHRYLGQAPAVLDRK